MTNNEEARRVSSSVGDYLKAIWLLGTDGPVSTKALAGHLGVAPASVSGMLVRLDDQGLIHHERYHGASLTAAGEEQALRLVRRHRLIESFLVQHMGYAWDEVHSEAEVLEHAVSDRFVEQLDALLGHPTHDPHGDPIPTTGGRMPSTPDTLLTAVPAGSRYVVSRLDTQDSGNLVRLADLGLVPGRSIEILQNRPDPEDIRIRAAGHTHKVSKDLALLVHGEITASA